MKTCQHCGALNTSTVYSDCYRCGKKLPKGGTVIAPLNLGDGRTATRTPTSRDDNEKAVYEARHTRVI